MIVKGEWTNQYSQKDVDWKANGDQRIEDLMKNMKEKMEQDRLKWIRETH